MRRATETQGYSLVELIITLAIAGLIGGAVLGVYRVSQDTYIRASSLEAAQDGARAGLDRMANELRLIGSYWVGASCTLPDCNAITAATPGSITFRANVNDSYMSNANAAEATTASVTSGTSVPLSLLASDTTDAFRVYTGSGSSLNDYIYIANGGTREVGQINSINGNTLILPSGSPLRSTYPAGSLVRDVKTITYTRNAVAKTLTRTQGGDTTPDPIVDNVTALTFAYFDSAGGALPATPSNRGLIREIRIDLTVQDSHGGTRYMTTRVKPRSLP